MTERHMKLHILAKVAVILSFGCWIAQAQGTGFCLDKDPGPYCTNCLNAVYCTETDASTGTDGTNPHDCLPGEVCAILTDAASCVPYSSSTACACTAPSVCDPYGGGVMVCSPSGPVDVTECAVGQMCMDGVCAGTTVDPGTGTCVAGDVGWVLIKPDCTAGMYCTAAGPPSSSWECVEGEYFDAASGCLPAPPASCADCVGMCPDKLNCAQYYVCDENGMIEDVEPCPEGQNFNPDLSSCVIPTATDTFCPPTDGCEFGALTTTFKPITVTTTINTVTTTIDTTTIDTTTIDTTTIGTTTIDTTTIDTTTIDTTTIDTTTTTVSTTTTMTPTHPEECNESVQGNYPHETDCQMYWSCQQVSPGVWRWIARSCPDGYVFNPDTGYCDLAQNVPECVLTTTVGWL